MITSLDQWKCRVEEVRQQPRLLHTHARVFQNGFIMFGDEDFCV